MVDNRAQYRAKFAAVTPLLEPVLDVRLPDASFYLWAGVPAAWQGDDAAFARALYAQYNVTVLPGSYLAREAAAPTRAAAHPHGPGGRHRRMHRGRATHRELHPELSPSMTQQLQQTIDAAWEDRANISAHQRLEGSPRRRRSRDRRAQQRPAARRHARERRPVDGAPVDQEGRAAVLPPQGQRADAGRLAGLLRQGADQVLAPVGRRAEGSRRAHRAAGRGAPRQLHRQGRDPDALAT